MRISDVPAGQGVAGQIDGRPVAVYNSGDRITVLENVCTHMRCETGWNAEDPGWDCPCHGSRYGPDGSLQRGPARAPLPHLEFKIENDEIKLEEKKEEQRGEPAA